MTAIAMLSLINSEVPRSTLDRVAAIYPECVEQRTIFAELPTEDPRMIAILDELHRAGFSAWDHVHERRRGAEYNLRLSRTYSPAELSLFSFLEVAPDVRGWVDGQSPRTNSPEVVLYEAPMLDIGLVGMGRCYVASAKVYKALLSGGFSDLLWRQTKMKPSGAPPGERRSEYDKKLNPPKRGPWRALRSELVLPPLAPSMPLFHTDHSPFTGDFSKGCWRRDGLYTHAELRYRAADLEAFGPFDLAHTYEMFEALPREYDRPLVASQRFYQYCLKHGIETSWQPVRIEE